jgi:hypothetical protein
VSRVTTHVLALRGAEEHLARELRAVAERHQDEPEILHVARDLAGWSDAHVSRLTAAANRLPAEHDDVGPPAPPGTGTSSDGPLQLLFDLRTLFLLANGVALDWSMLEKYARAVHDSELVATAVACGGEASRQASWAQAMARTAAPQALTQP